MNKKKLYLIGGLAIVLIFVLSLPKTKKQTENPPLPVDSDESYSSNTGAIYNTPEPEDQVEIDQIRELRSSLPRETDYFTINYDYGDNVFRVKFTDDNKEGVEEFYRWLKEEGYGAISLKYFSIDRE